MNQSSTVKPLYPGIYPSSSSQDDELPYPRAALNLTLGFDLETWQIPLEELMPSKKVPDGVMTTRKFRQIVSSIREIGLIEPLSVIKPDPKVPGFLLLDGNLRVLALKELGQDTAPCLIAKDFETYTYNHRINRLSTVQEHYMLRRAIDKGVSKERLARAFSVNLSTINSRVNLLHGICPKAVELLQDHQFTPDVTRHLRKMKAARQIEAVELMIAANTITGAHADVLGRDVRASSEALAQAVAKGLIDQGCEVLDLGLSGTEEMYFATTHFGADGGICVTASHNPMDYNGMKMVRGGSAPLDAATGLARVKELAELNAFEKRAKPGKVRHVAGEARSAYVERICEFIDVAALRPLKILVNAGHGTAGPTFDAIAARLADLGAPLVFEPLFHEPDGTFPQGIPNPLLPENRPATADAVRALGADFGVAWDGDFDRCFFFDHTGEFIDGEYVVGLLAEASLAKDPGATIIHDPRIIWNTQDLVAKAGGRAVQTRTGHAFIKQAMRDENAVYGGEMSAHHYFRDFVYCDSGMIPWLLVAELVSRHGPLADLAADRKAAFPSSGEINFTLDDPQTAIARVRAEFEPEAISIDEMDGLGFDLGDWRFNLRSSNTEPVVRLNVEARGDKELVAQGVARVKRTLLW